MKNEHFFEWDNRRDIANPGNTEETILFAVEHFIQCAKESIQANNRFAVALSGGSTPKKIYETLATPAYSQSINWSQVMVFWSDERAVPPTDKDSNFRMALEACFKKVPVPTNHIFRMKSETNITQNAQSYEQTIKDTLQGAPFDLVMLGMGEDGHTASLFPNTQALKEENHLVVANEIPQNQTSRMTLTYPCINQAKNIVIYVTGKKKSEPLKCVFVDNKPRSIYPIVDIGTKTNKALWVIDNDASAALLAYKKTNL